MFDKETMRARFHDLGAKREKVLATLDPIKAKREALIADHEAQVRPLEQQIRDISAGLYEIDVERGLIAKALQGKTGAPA